MLDNAPPRVIALLDALAFIKLLSEPEGLRQIKGELKPLTDAAVVAHKKLGERQKEIAEADKALQATQANHDRALAALAKKQGEATAAVVALETATAKHEALFQAEHQKLEARETKLREERQQHRQDKQDLAKARAELEQDLSELAALKGEVEKRERAARELLAKAEALRADYEAKAASLKAHLSA